MALFIVNARRGEKLMGDVAIDDSEIQSDERFAEAVRLIVALKAEGSKTSAIATRLNMDGFVTKKGMPWTQFTVHNAISAVRKAAEPIKLAPSKKNPPAHIEPQGAPVERAYSLEEAACILVSGVLADEKTAARDRVWLAGQLLRAVVR